MHLQTLATVGAGITNGLLETAERLGVERDELLGAAGIDPAVLLDSRARLPVQDVIALFELAGRLSGRRDIALEFARQVRPATFHVLGYALMTCRTLGEALDLVPHYRRLVFDAGYSEMRLARHGELGALEWHVLHPRRSHAAVLTEALLASWWQFGRWMVGGELPLRRVTFAHAAGGGSEPFAAFFGCPVEFRAAVNSLVFDRRLLQMPMAQADEALHLAMREQARAAMDATFGAGNVGQQVRAVLVTLLPRCEATLERCADALAHAPRTLQRRLADAGLSFEAVLEAVRKDLARVYLRDRALSLLDVALLLGYSEQSSFTRAFRRWHGATPLSWRRGQALPRGAR